ncbi:MAG: hypothetical protein HN919_02410 [Verrucomicrobia bacterium]|jgi:hypothetical protein|nr:hypothetical protein [Verrucomicrobiota bacterium]
MKWQKLGKIFDTRDHDLPHGCTEFAQSPQVLVFDDFLRIYFSTRCRDPLNGKYLSRIAFVDMKKDLRHINRVSAHTVVEPGELGCYDEHGIFPLNVVRAGNVVHGYIGGWNRRVSVSVDTSIGLAVSKDNGFTFQRSGRGPVLTSSLHEPFLVGDPFVVHHANIFHIWYIFGTRWQRFVPDAPPDRVYKIGHAVSADGVEWRRPQEGQQIIDESLGADESQAMPTVAQFDGRYHMFFCYRQSSDFRHNPTRGYRIGHAHSDDLTNWIRNDAVGGMDVSETGWDSEMLCYPHVFGCDGQHYLLYNGNEFGRYGFGAAVLE